jgi:dolichol-phosphate mannosyltransferase
LVQREIVKLSVVIPAHNEEGTIERTVADTRARLDATGKDFEILVVDDGSTDATPAILARLASNDGRIDSIRSPNPGGFGFAVRAGLATFSGDAVAIVMADGSDSPDDLVTYWDLLEDGYDCAFGSRFIAGGEVEDYPRGKLILNRIVNTGIRLLFGHRYNDTTNAFKAYRRETIESVQPILSNHFNLTVELPLKAIVRGNSYAIVPIRWRNRASGDSKFGIQEMGGRYLFIILYAFLEYHLSRGDYRAGGPERRRWRAGVPGEIDEARRK